MNQPNTTSALPPAAERADPLLVNQIVPVVNQQQMLANLKQLSAI